MVCAGSNVTFKEWSVPTVDLNGWAAGVSEVSELLIEVTILAALFCCYFVCCWMTNLLCLDFWVLGWAYFQLLWAYFPMGWAYFWERGFSKICPPPSLSSHLTSSSPMGVFSRDYGTERLPLANHLCLSSCNHLTFMRDSRLIHTVDCPWPRWFYSFYSNHWPLCRVYKL